MATIVTRAGKGSALTHNEVDANFNNLNNDKIEAAQTVTLTNKTLSTGTAITAGTINGATIGATTPSSGAFTTLSATGVTTVQAGTVSAPAITTSGDTNTGIFFPAADTIAFTEGGVESMRIDSSGNVGIGTSSPGAALDVEGLGNTVEAHIFTSDNVLNATASLVFGTTPGARSKASVSMVNTSTGNGAGALVLSTNNGTSLTERLRIDSSGNVGIGTTSPSTFGQLAVYGNGTAPVIANFLGSNSPATNATYGDIAFGSRTDGTVTARIRGLANDNGNGTDGQLSFWTADNTAGAGALTERMRLDASGNLGIGQTSMSQPLEIKRGSGVAAFIEVAGNNNTPGSTSAVYGQDSSGNAFAWNRANLAFLFGTNNAERARITSGGDFLVATTDAALTSGVGQKFVYSATAPKIAIVGSASTNASTAYALYSTGAGAYRFYVDYSGTISATTTTITGISDVRLKENIRDLDDGLDAVMLLKPRKFDWKEGKGANIKDARGFIAQEFEQVFPDMIEQWMDEPPEGEEPYKAVNANLIPTLVKAIQELNAKVEAQAAEIAALKGNA